jgi:hypothetical protein
MSFVKDLAQITYAPFQAAVVKITVVILALLCLLIIAFGLNIMELRILNVPLFFLGGVVIVLLGFKPAVIATFLGLGVIYQQANNASTVSGIAIGISAWYRAVMVALFLYWVAIGLLVILPWHQAPGMYWVILVALAFCAVMTQAYGLSPSPKWVVYPVMVGTIVVIIMALLLIVPDSWRGKMFDQTNGQALYMMEDDGSRVFTEVTPEDCGVTDIKGVKTATKCFSPYTGRALVVVTPKVAEKQKVFRMPDFKVPEIMKIGQSKPSAGKPAEGKQDDIETQEGGSIFVAKGASITRYVTGTVTIINTVPCHYVAVLPKDTFDIVPVEGDIFRTEITAFKSPEKARLVSLTSMFDKKGKGCSKKPRRVVVNDWKDEEYSHHHSDSYID